MRRIENPSEERPGTGIYAKRNWQELRTGGGIAPSEKEISFILDTRGEKMALNREQTKEIISDYFRRKTSVVVDEEGEEVTVWKSAPTKGELAAVLGISVPTLCRYCDGQYSGRKYQGLTTERILPEAFDILRAAMQIIENFYESKLSENRNNTGTIFWLLNSQSDHWTNEQQIRLEQTDNNTEPQMPAEEVLRLRQERQERRELPEKPVL